VVLAAAVTLAVLGVAVGLLTTRGSRAGLKSLPPNSLGLIDAASGRLEAAVALPGVPVALAGSANRIWVALGEPHEIVEVDPGKRKVLETFPVRAVPRRIAPAPDGIWTAESYDGTIAHVDAATQTLGKSVRLFRPTRISFTPEGELWAASNSGNNAARLDANTAQVLERFAPLDAPIAVTNGFDAVWFASATRAEVERLRHSHVTRIPIGAPPVDVTAGATAIWAISPGDDKLWGIDPRSRAVVHIVDVGPDPESVVAGGGSIWVGSRQAEAVTRVDPQTSRVVSTLELQRPVTALSFYAGQLWVAGA
jgi:streptogramin lyase